MGQYYIFHESGSIPGIPGTFAHCQVQVLDDGELQVTPLGQHPAFTEPVVSIDAQSSLDQPIVAAEPNGTQIQAIVSTPLVQNGG